MIFLRFAPHFYISPSNFLPFYDYYVIYSHTKHIFLHKVFFFLDYNCMIIILWEQFFVLRRGKRKFVKRWKRWKMLAKDGKNEINVNFLNILSSFANMEYMKAKAGKKNVVITPRKFISTSLVKHCRRGNLIFA